jgi:hypothetical protein
MPAMPQSATQSVSPAAPGEPATPSSQPPFGVPPGETIYTNSPSYERPLPSEAVHPRTAAYLIAALAVVVVSILAAMAASGMLH